MKYKKPSKQELKDKLTPEQYSCTQEEATEPPFKNKYWNHKEPGIYVDIVSGEALFSSTDKFDSGSGWPSFTKAIESESLHTKSDFKLAVPRTEVRSKKADSHLGHVFEDGPGPTKKRFCINSAALKFIPLDKMLEEGYGTHLIHFLDLKKWEAAVLAGGCFWGVQELFRVRKGVIFSEAGYTGGDIKFRSYEEVKTGNTGHAEAVRIIFDPLVISYEDILLYFFKIHDPTTLNQQGGDRGTQYRSEIFYLSEKQKSSALRVIERVNKSKKWGGPVVTNLSAAAPFIRAEEYHQDYLKKDPNDYTCHFPRNFEF